MNSQSPLQAFQDAGRANADAIRSLGASAISATERLLALNLDFARAALARGAEFALTTPASGDWQISAQGVELRAFAESAADYLRSVQEIAADARHEAEQVISSRLAEGRDALGATLDAVMQNGPAGSQAAASVMRSAIDKNRIAYENIVLATRKVAEANAAAVSNAVKAMGMSAATAARKAA